MLASQVSTPGLLSSTQALRTSLDLRPNEPQAEHMLEALASDQGGAEGAARLQRASPQFVRSLFDDFSDTFEEKLHALQYQVPQLGRTLTPTPTPIPSLTPTPIQP